MTNQAIKAVHDDDLSELLISLGVYNSVVEKLSSCYFCGRKIGEDDILAILPVDNEIAFCCNNNSCKLNLIGLKEKEGK